MSRLYMTFVSLFIAAPLLWAQDNPDYWYRGTLHLKSGESLEAMLQHDQKKDYVLLMQGSGIKAYNAGQIDFYEVFDPLSRSHRTFYPLPLSEKRRKRYQFFELLHEGELVLLSRETERRQERFTPHPFQEGMMHHPGMFYRPGMMHHPSMMHRPFMHIIKVDEFYILDHKRRMHRFEGNKKELLTLMADQAGKIEAFIHSKKLNLYDKAHLKAIFSYYNALQRMKEKEHTEDRHKPELSTHFQPLQ